MENKEKDYKEERFEFTIYVNDNIICKRNFRIYNYIENSMQSIEFKDKVDEIVRMIDNDLKSKSRVYTWFYYNPDDLIEGDEFDSPLIDPWVCTFKIVISDNKNDVITKIWDGYAYPKAVRDKVDLSNKNVKVMSDGQLYVYDKDSFFKANEGRLSFEHELLKAMIMDKQDVLLQITKKICEACSPSKDEIKEVNQRGHFDTRDNTKYLVMKYTLVDEYGNDEVTKKATGEKLKPKRYAYSLQLANKKLEKDWEKYTQKKTAKYLKEWF